ncbi:MAG: hypothetical protein HY923_08840 [Elusimicrobia bacterium]|nr:hypothetical protein [Elusimicrobiota bacterium]
MRKLFAVSLILMLALPAPADQVDMGAVFDEDFRDQCDTGSCHAFASIAILEAAMKRRRRDAEPVLLSDADLFLRTNVINGVSAARYSVDPRLSERVLIEGGWPSRDLRIALELGVARAETVPWDGFLRKFETFREKRRDECRAAGCEGESALLAYEASLAPSPEREREEIGYFYGAAMLARAEADREEVRRLLKGFTVHSSTFASTFNAPSRDEDARCRAAGAPVKARLMEDLAVRRPVAICLSLGGLPEWGAPAMHAKHCVAVRGYRQPRGGAMALLVRNSWGEDRHPDVPENRFCRIHEVTAVRP